MEVKEYARVVAFRAARSKQRGFLPEDGAGGSPREEPALTNRLTARKTTTQKVPGACSTHHEARGLNPRRTTPPIPSSLVNGKARRPAQQAARRPGTASPAKAGRRNITRPEDSTHDAPRRKSLSSLVNDSGQGPAGA